MDRKSLFQIIMKVAGEKLIHLAVLGMALSAFIMGLVLVHSGKFTSITNMIVGNSQVSKVVEVYADAFESLQKKAEALRHAEQENERLMLENANLRLRAEELHFNCEATEAKSHTRNLEGKLLGQTGTGAGRTIASITYRPPGNLVPSQLYTLAISYFKGHEDEKAAVIFSLLTGFQDNDTYKTPKNFLLTGVAWYRLDNLEAADQYFDRVLKFTDTTENLRYQAHARLWKALVAERSQKHHKAQYWLRELVDYHPKSAEASWINPAAQRVPASQAPVKMEKKAEKHEE